MKYPDAETRAAALKGYDDDIRRAEKAVAQAAIDYVNYFFPISESGEGLDNESGRLMRSIRALERVRKRVV